METMHTDVRVKRLKRSFLAECRKESGFALMLIPFSVGITWFFRGSNGGLAVANRM